MRKALRLILVTLAGGLVLAIVFGVVSQWFIEWAREEGWYDKPSQRLDVVMSAFSSFVTQTWFLALTAALVGLAIGVWIDLFLRRREVTSTSIADPLPEPPMEEIVGRAFRQERVYLDYKKFIKCTFANVTFVYNGLGRFDMDRCQMEGPVTFASDVKEINNYIALLNTLGALRLTVEDPYGHVPPSPEIHFMTHEGKELLPEREVHPAEANFSGVQLRLMTTFPQVTQDKTFVRCELVGPANVALWGFSIHGTKCVQCDFILFDLQKRPANVMVLVNPKIEDCTLMGLTLFIQKEDREKFQKGFPEPIPWINWEPPQNAGESS